MSLGLFARRHLLIFFSCLFSLVGAAKAAPFEPFLIDDIRVEGLERIQLGTFMTYLPVQEGEMLDELKASRIIKSLHRKGLFDDVSLGRDANELVIVVQESPMISAVEITGNKLVDTETLEEGLKDMGLAAGEVLNRPLVRKIDQELEEQYYNLGRYAVDVDVSLKPQPGNKVTLAIDVNEGSIARIKAINIIGNTYYTEEELLSDFKLKSSRWYSFVVKSDQYSRQRLAGDLEALKSKYMDEGFLKFQIDSTQVSITPDKREVYITISINEGEQYLFAGYDVAGDFLLERETLLEDVGAHIEPGAFFSRKAITQASTALTNRLGNEGYAFANVNPIPEIDEEAKTVGLTFFVDPGRRVYVRRIYFDGNLKTADEVLRREMRQMEGAWSSAQKIELSKARLDRLGYFSDVKVETQPVLGEPDQMDVKFSVVEQPSGSISAGVGYAQGRGILLNLDLNQKNFLGTGNRVNLRFNTSKSTTIYNFAYTDPYLTQDGVSGSFKLFYRKTDANKRNTNDYFHDSYGGSFNFGVPLSETSRASFGFEYADNTIKARGQGEDKVFSLQLIDFFADHGEALSDANNEIDFSHFTLNTTYTRDSRNRALFPTAGSMDQFAFELALPGGDLEYYKATYTGRRYYSIESWWSRLADWVLLFRADLGFGDGYGDTESLPFFENYYAGGISNFRGFRSNSVGPREILVFEEDGFDKVKVGDPIGGNLRMVGGVDVIFPTPFVESDAMRTSWFIDVGAVFDTDFEVNESALNEKPGEGTSIPEFFDLSTLRVSTGVSLTWLTQLGPLSFSLGLPVKKESEDATELFQFSFGTTF